MNELLPVVSVFCPTYNHEKYISECLDGIVMQQTNFAIEVIVQDDASTDYTAEIIKKYASKYNYIIPILHNENHYSKGKNLNEYFFKNAKGKYFAFCEGDDYWTDPYKLQKQVDFLEANSDFAICFHNTEERYQNNEKPSYLYCKEDQKEVTTIEDLLYKSNFIPTCSVVFRNSLFSYFPIWFANLGMGDWIIHILNAQYGKIRYINEVMGVHRIHREGVWSKNSEVRNHILIYEAYVALSKHFYSQKALLNIITLKEKEYLKLIYTFYIYQKDKKTAGKYINKLLKKNIWLIFKIRVLKDFIKIHFIN